MSTKVEKSPDLFVQTLNEIPQLEITRMIPDMSAIDQNFIRILIRDLKKSQVHGLTKKFSVKYFKKMRL